ncbi:MAG TPA: aldehyde dehydrogenase family protein [Mycobacteriales bacterium]|jgi:acyl-CoA reductase-like NAD-dependent aldehyde dehydrogenase|nr:aldehyde dehydrogenase family protein [Mycobacteriales bacterium]
MTTSTDTTRPSGSALGAEPGPDDETFPSLDPATGRVLATYRRQGAAEVGQVVAAAGEAALWWQAQGPAARRTHLRAWKGVLARRLHELADLVHAENGKPHADAVLEITLAVDHIEWAARHAPKMLGPRRVPSGLMAANQAATLEYLPLGVIGVIGPWNYPVFTPMGSLAYALAAGNAVVFKPSEYTTGVGAWLVQAWHAAVPERPDVLQLVTGLGDTGAALCRSGVDKIAFTGSAATGRKVMAACAEGLVPVLMECGGKDAMIVDDDADVGAAADAALWGGMSNAGQTCIGIERVYATEQVYDAFVGELTRRAVTVRPGSDAGASYGPITMPGQVDIIRRHIADALSAGGRAVTGGGIDGAYVQPTVLVDVPDSSAAVQEETFGPTLTVSRVRDAEEALLRTNATSYGLAGAVFSGSKERGMDLARRMRSGMTSVNSVITFASVPGLPFGGVGDSGFGRIHGEDGLKEFTRAKSITRQTFALPTPLLTFARHPKLTDRLAKVIQVVHGRG